MLVGYLLDIAEIMHFWLIFFVDWASFPEAANGLLKQKEGRVKQIY